MADVNFWSDPAHARRYLEETRHWAWRESAYGALGEWVPPGARRVLDLGCGDGEVAARVLEWCPQAEVVAADFSEEMLRRAQQRFEDESRVTVVPHDLDEPLPMWMGTFDAVVSAFAIHHVVDERKRALYGEIRDHLEPGGTFANLEHVASATREIHEAFLASIGTPLEGDDPSNKLAPVETQLTWLRELGYVQVDCHYKWREIALLAGIRP